MVVQGYENDHFGDKMAMELSQKLSEDACIMKGTS